MRFVSDVARALVGIEVRRVVLRGLARLRVVDPERRCRAHVEVNEDRVRVVADTDVPKRAAVVADDVVRDAIYPEIDRVAEVVVRVRGVLRRRIGPETRDDVDLPAAE